MTKKKNCASAKQAFVRAKNSWTFGHLWILLEGKWFYSMLGSERTNAIMFNTTMYRE
jgi:hypothetical protein